MALEKNPEMLIIQNVTIKIEWYIILETKITQLDACKAYLEESGLRVDAFMESSSRDCLIYGIYVLVFMFQLNVVDPNVNFK